MSSASKMKKKNPDMTAKLIDETVSSQSTKTFVQSPQKPHTNRYSHSSRKPTGYRVS